MKVKVLGISSYDKDNKKCYNVYYATPFTDTQINAGALGVKVSTVWTNQIDFSTVRPGDYLDLNFEPGFQDRATLTGYSPISSNPFNQHISGLMDFSSADPKDKK